MNGQNTNNQQPTLIDTIENFLKNRWVMLLGGFIGLVGFNAIIYRISYLSSFIFLKAYLELIDFLPLFHDITLESHIIEKIALAIFILILSVILAFCLITMLMRYFYHQIKPNFLAVHRLYRKHINILFLMLFLLTLSIIPIAIFKLSIWIYIGIYFLITLLSLIYIYYIYHKKYHRKWDKDTTIDFFITGFGMFGIIITLSTMPFSIILQAISHLEITGIAQYFFLVVIWVIISFLYGLRISSQKNIHYLIDVILSFIILVYILIYSPNTIKIATAEILSIKDKHSIIYAITEENFYHIKANIDSHWHTYYQDKTEKEKILLYAKNTANQQIYLNIQIIFRNQNMAVVCPPDYQLTEPMPGICFITPKEQLVPTSFTQESIEKNKHFYHKIYHTDKPRQS